MDPVWVIVWVGGWIDSALQPSGIFVFAAPFAPATIALTPKRIEQRTGSDMPIEHVTRTRAFEKQRTHHIIRK